MSAFTKHEKNPEGFKSFPSCYSTAPIPELFVSQANYSLELVVGCASRTALANANLVCSIACIDFIVHFIGVCSYYWLFFFGHGGTS